MLSHLALVRLPGGGFEALARCDHPRVAEALAANPGLPGELVDRLARRGGAGALARTTDTSLLGPEVARHDTESALGVAANRLSAPELLAELLASTTPRVRRAALTNPSTPTSAVLAAAAGCSAGFLTATSHNSSTNNTLRAVRCGLALSAHPALAGPWSGDGAATTKRMVARLPELPASAVARLASHGAKRILALNPFVAPGAVAGVARLRLEGFLDGRSLERALASPAGRRDGALLASPTVDLVLASHPELEMGTAALFIGSPESRPAAEADVLGMVVERFGPELAAAVSSGCAKTRCIAATECSPTMAALAGLAVPGAAEWSAMERSAARLGDDARGWELVVGLAPDWDGSAAELVEAAAAMGA